MLIGTLFWHICEILGRPRSWWPPNFKVYYDKKVTKVKKLLGLVACELSSATYGATVWWVLLEEVV